MIIYLDDYRAALAVDVSEHSRYDEEVLCANWNYAIQLIAMKTYQDPQESLSPELPEDFSNMDIDAFLDRVYALATGI